MCTVKTPKPDPNAVAAAQKKPQYLTNPWLDGLAIQNNGAASGRNSLVIAPGTQPPSATTNAPPTALPIFTAPNTNLSLGAGGGFAGGGIGNGRSGLGIKML